MPGPSNGWSPGSLGWKPTGRPCYVLDQARLRPHEPPASTSGFIYLTISKPAVFERFLSEQGFRREPKTGTLQCCQYTLTQAARHAVSQSFSAPTFSSLSDPGPSQPSRWLKVSLLSRLSSSSDSRFERLSQLSSFCSAESPVPTSTQQLRSPTQSLEKHPWKCFYHTSRSKF